MSSLVMETRKLQKVRERARPALDYCICGGKNGAGCKSKTRGRFAPGHDALLRQRLNATIEEGPPEAAKLAKQILDALDW